MTAFDSIYVSFVFLIFNIVRGKIQHFAGAVTAAFHVISGFRDLAFVSTVAIIVYCIYKEPYKDYKSYDHQLHNAPLMERIHSDPFFT